MRTIFVGLRLGDAIDPFHLVNGFEAVIGHECQERSNHPFSHSYNAGEVLQCRQEGAGNMERYNQFIEACRSSLALYAYPRLIRWGGGFVLWRRGQLSRRSSIQGDEISCIRDHLK